MDRNRKKLKIKLTKRKTALITAAAVLVCAAGGYFIHKNKTKKASAPVEQAVDMVTYGDIKAVTTGEASVEPYERYEIISMVSGDIISSPYDVGDMVNEGDILYQFDTENARKSIEKQEISLQQSKNSLANARSDYQDAQEKLLITAPCSGIISGLTIKKGNDVQNNQQIAQLDNTKQLEVSVPFTSEQINSIYVGQTAYVSSSSHMSSVSGKVSSVSSEALAQDNGSQTYNVTIEFENPGAFTQGLTVGAEINGMQSPGYGTVEYSESGTVKAEASGAVSAVNYSNGDYVEEGAVIAVISSDALDSQQRSLTSSELNLKSAELSMQESRDSLDDYSITSPISGTVITKNAKAGDTIDRTNSTTTLMVVADISKLKFSMEIDELDISTVHEGQSVDITCDALPNENFEGKITSISVEGTATNGVTTYTAEVVIENPGNLRPSMNIDASIIIDSAENVLIAPTADIKTIMGVSYVYLQDETGTKGASEEDFMRAMRGSMENSAPAAAEGKPMGEMPEGMERPEGMEISGGAERSEGMKRKNGLERTDSMDNEENSEKDRKETENSKKDGQQGQSRLPEAPEGFVIAIVETGVTDDEYTEIKSGLQDGDIIQRLAAETSSSNNMMMRMGGMGAMGGGMPGGGMPSGGGMSGRGMR